MVFKLKATLSLQINIVILDNSIFVGNITRRSLPALLEEGSISEHYYNKCYRAVCVFYVKSMDYIKETFSLDDDIIKHAKLTNFQLRDGIDFSYITFFCREVCKLKKMQLLFFHFVFKYVVLTCLDMRIY